MKKRCAWVTADPIYIKYHDEEWGKPVYDDNQLFAQLCLEGAQAGLSWLTVLKKRSHYQKVFFDFQPAFVVAMTDEQLEDVLKDPGIIRHRLKVFSVHTNAQAFLKVQAEFGSFSNYLWGWVEPQPIVNHWLNLTEMPNRSNLSDTLAKDLKARGFKFVGSTIIYAFLQSMGLIVDHTTDCWCYQTSAKYT